MTQRTSFGAKIAAAIVGGFIGFCIGPFLGTMAGALIGNALGSEGPEPSVVGNALGMSDGDTMTKQLVARQFIRKGVPDEYGGSYEMG
jgi:hypothetical protein